MADKETTSSRTGGTRQAPPRRNDVIRCENCGEEYSVTYKRCPFCDERPGRSSRPGGRSSGGRRVANNKRGGGYGGPVNPIHVIWLVISLVVIIAAAVIVIRFVGGPLLGGGDSSAADPGSSQTDTSQPGGDGGQVQGPAAESITLSRTDFTLQYDEPYQLTATVTPAGGEPVVWTSSDPSILTVDEEGLLHNVNTGTELQRVVVTATCGGVQAQCEVYCRAQNAGRTGDHHPRQSGRRDGHGGQRGHHQRPRRPVHPVGPRLGVRRAGQRPGRRLRHHPGGGERLVPDRVQPGPGGLCVRRLCGREQLSEGSDRAGDPALSLFLVAFPRKVG